MPVFMNKLETTQDIVDYKEWLKTRPLHFLYHFNNNFKRDMQRENPIYVNHALRIELVNAEIKKRLN